MDRWKQLNVYVSLGGLLLFIISLFLIKYNILILCIGAFGLGISFKGFKNIYKNVNPPKMEKVTNPYDKNQNKKKKKKRKR